MRPRPALLALVALLALAALPAPASAQGETFPTTLTLQVTGPDMPIRPDVHVASYTLEVTYTTSGAPALAPTEVALSVTQAPAWAEVVIDPPTLTFPGVETPCTCTERDEVLTANVLVRTTLEAPAFMAEPVGISATAAPNTPHQASQGEASFFVTADYYSILSVQVDPAELDVERGSSATTFVKVENQGNGLTRVAFEVEPSHPNLEVVPLNPLSIPPRHGGASNVGIPVPLTVKANGPVTDGYVMLRVTGAYALDTMIRGDDKRIEIPVRVLEPASSTPPEGSEEEPTEPPVEPDVARNADAVGVAAALAGLAAVAVARRGGFNRR